MNILLRDEGKMKVAMLIASCSCFLNIVLASVLIAWVGWGIQGAAWATVIAQLAYFLGQTCFHWRGNTRLRLMSAKLRGIMRLDRTGGKGGYTGHTDADYEHYPGVGCKGSGPERRGKSSGFDDCGYALLFADLFYYLRYCLWYAAGGGHEFRGQGL